MNLKAKRILIFGGNANLIEHLVPIFLQEEAKPLWCQKPEAFKDSSEALLRLPFPSIDSISTYQMELTTLLQEQQPFDGVLYALSEGSLRPLSMTKPHVAQRLMEVNSLAFMELVRILIKNRKLNTGASILALSSVSSLKGLKTKMAYAASKAALNAVVLNMAAELATKKIRVNAILKGALTTDLNEAHVRNMITLGSDQSSNSVLGMTSPEELARFSAFILSDAVKTMTGSLIKLDGGYSL